MYCDPELYDAVVRALERSADERGFCRKARLLDVGVAQGYSESAARIEIGKVTSELLEQGQLAQCFDHGGAFGDLAVWRLTEDWAPPTLFRLDRSPRERVSALGA